MGRGNLFLEPAPFGLENVELRLRLLDACLQLLEADLFAGDGTFGRLHLLLLAMQTFMQWSELAQQILASRLQLA